jgi:hypothetical protein
VRASALRHVARHLHSRLPLAAAFATAIALAGFAVEVMLQLSWRFS